jgi:hypothetical protein
MMNMSRTRNLRNSNVQKFDNNRKLPFDVGGKEKGKVNFNRPWGIDCDFDNNIHPNEHNNHLIQKFDSKDNLYVKDTQNQFIQFFSSNDLCLKSIAMKDTCPCEFMLVHGFKRHC